MVKNISFYVKSQGGDPEELKKVSLQLRTAGGDCRRLLRSTFQDFFSRTGVHVGPFRWGPEYFPTSPGEGMEDDEEVEASQSHSQGRPGR